MLLFVTCLHICQVSTGRLITVFIMIAEVAVRRLEFPVSSSNILFVVLLQSVGVHGLHHGKRTSVQGRRQEL